MAFEFSTFRGLDAEIFEFEKVGDRAQAVVSVYLEGTRSYGIPEPTLADTKLFLEQLRHTLPFPAGAQGEQDHTSLNAAAATVTIPYTNEADLAKLNEQFRANFKQACEAAVKQYDDAKRKQEKPVVGAHTQILADASPVGSSQNK